MARLNATNLARTTLANDLLVNQTTMVVQDQTPFPQPPFRVTIFDLLNNEIVEVTNVSGNTWTVLRAREGTVQRNWPRGTRVELRWTAGMYEELRTQVNNKADVLGNRTIAFVQQNLTVSSTGTYTIDWRNGNRAKLVFTQQQTATLNFVAPPGACGLTLIVQNDPTGQSQIVWPDSIKWSGGVAPTLSQRANGVDIFTFSYDGENYYGQGIFDFV